MPLSVLTDFEEFAVYDTRKRPSERDRASAARLLFLGFEEYAERWRAVWDVFSKEAVLGGAFDQFAGSAAPRPKTQVGAEFLKDMEVWRELLARNFALRNPRLSVDDLNDAVQRTIDRIVFLRMAEDRGMEEHGRLQQLADKGEAYRGLVRLARQADDKYNSGLFDFSRDKLTPGLALDDKVLRGILLDLYFPHSPYAFNVLPPEILGSVYERFLGKVIRLTAGHQAKVEEKPEVRKAGGVYYTPAYIVNYIVGQTVGVGIAGKSPTQLRGYRVLDMACGSGSFLLGAYQVLLDHYLLWYTENSPEKHPKAVYVANPSSGYNPHPSPPPERGRESRPLPLEEPQVPEAQRRGAGLGRGSVLTDQPSWRLTSAERKRILTEHIYGVDIDRQAVEVTKLSLLLKVLEGETDETLGRQMRLIHDRALPDLERNIQCGNSLIGPEYFSGRLLPDADELKRVNPFDWKAAFPEAMAAGGFDAVIGNPPYVLVQTLEQPAIFRYLGEHYKSAKYKIDTYQVFLERSISLIRTNGRVAYIVPNSFLKNKHAFDLRALILMQTNVQALRLFTYNVFPAASVDTCVLVLHRKTAPEVDHRVEIIRSSSPSESEPSTWQPQRGWTDHAEKFFVLPGAEGTAAILAKISGKSGPLGDFATAYFGIQTFDRGRFVRRSRQNRRFRPVIDGGNITRYHLAHPTEFVDFREEAIKSGGKEDVYEQRRIGVRQIGRTPVSTILPAGIYTLNTVYNIYFTKRVLCTLDFILGIIASRLMAWYWEHSFFDEKRTFPKIKKDAILSIPICRINFDDTTEKSRHDKMVSLVERMLELHKRRQAVESDGERELLQRQIDSTDGEIDALVYELYGLSEEEIRIVEGK